MNEEMVVDKKQKRYKSVLHAVQLTFYIISYFVLFEISEKSDYIKNCNAQYGRLIFSLLVSGLLSNLILALVRAWNSSKIGTSFGSKLSFGLYFLFGASMFWISLIAWFGKWLDHLDTIIFILSVILIIAGLIEIKKSSINRLLFWSSDFPLFVGCLIVVLIRHFYENELTQEYIQSIINHIPESSFDPERYDKIGAIRKLLKDNFWIGISTGVVTIQLVNSQITQIILKMFSKNQN